jgi:hypothetical protein
MHLSVLVPQPLVLLKSHQLSHVEVRSSLMTSHFRQANYNIRQYVTRNARLTAHYGQVTYAIDDQFAQDGKGESAANNLSGRNQHHPAKAGRTYLICGGWLPFSVNSKNKVSERLGIILS